MKKATKAALLSALVCPGAGHYYLKKRISALVYFGASAVLIYKILSTVYSKALEISEQIQSGAVAPDIAAIANLASQQPEGMASYAWNAFILCWLIGIIDSYRLGRAQDKLPTDVVGNR